MTVSTETASVSYAGNGSTVVWAVPFYVLENSHIKVTVRSSLGVESIKTLTTDYTVADAGTNPSTATVTAVTFTPATGETILIERDVPATQETDLAENDALPAETVEKVFDKLTMLYQQVTTAVSRALRLPASSQVSSQLAEPAAGQIMRVNSTKTGIDWIDYSVSVPADEDVFLVSNVATMEALTGLTDQARISTDGYSVAGIGNGHYIYYSTPPGTHDGFKYIDQTTGGGQFVLIEDRPNILQAGAETDGVTSSQVAIEAAAAYCAANGTELYWPDVGAPYVSTATIPDFHTVRHSGPGSILRGSTTFYIEPKSTQTNNLYVATTGSDSNDGLTSTAPLLTNQKAFDLLKERGAANQSGVLRGRWVINVAAGTYTEFVTFDSATRSEFPVDWEGPTAGHPNVPTVIIDGTGNETESGISLAVQSWLRITDILFQDFDAGNAAENNGSNLSLTNVHTDNCRTSVSNLHGGFVSVRGGIWDGNSIADSIGYNSFYCATHDFSQATNDAATDALVIKNFARGALINEGVQGHFDNVNITDCTEAALNIKRGAGAINTKTMKIQRNAVGVLTENNAWFNNGIDFGTGADVNTVNVRQLGGGGELDFLCQQNSARTSRLIVATNVAAHTGVTTETLLWTSPTIDDWCISEAGHVAKIRIGGSCSALAGTATLRFYLNDGTDDGICTAVIPAGVTEFVAEWQCSYSASNAQRGFLYVIRDGGNPIVDIQTGNRSLKNATHVVKVTLQLSNGADSVTLDQLTFEGTYGG